VRGHVAVASLSGFHFRISIVASIRFFFLNLQEKHHFPSWGSALACPTLKCALPPLWIHQESKFLQNLNSFDETNDSIFNDVKQMALLKKLVRVIACIDPA
jgi:hypothetical protein